MATVATPSDDGLSKRVRCAWLALILVVATGVRVVHLDWALPGFIFPDTVMHFLQPATRLAANGEWIPELFVHPPPFVQLLGLTFRGWTWLTGVPLESVASRGRMLLAFDEFAETGDVPVYDTQLAELVVVGRALTAVFSVLSVVVVYLLGRRLLGARAGLIAAALFALSPVGVLESHRVAADVPMVFFFLLSAYLTALSAQTGRTTTLFWAFAVGGLSGATKYTGLAAVTAPAWVAARWPDSSRRMRLFFLGGTVAALAFLLAMWPAWFALDKLGTAVAALFYGGMVFGQAGQDLQGQSWIYTRYVYSLVVGLPYLVGWPTYVFGLAGFAALARRDRRAFGILAAAALPFFLVMGAAEAPVPRYFQPLSGFLALGAGFALARLWVWRAVVGAAAVALAVAYTGIFAAGQAARLDYGPQRSVGQIVDALNASSDRDVVVGYVMGGMLSYDSIWPEFLKPGVRVVGGPRFRLVREGSDDTEDRRHEDWLRRKNVDVVVVPGRLEFVVEQRGVTGGDAAFVDRLRSGELGYRLVGEFRSSAPSLPLYTWGDPTLREHWSTGVTTYAVFAREPAEG